jgi:hypothetical protein
VGDPLAPVLREAIDLAATLERINRQWGEKATAPEPRRRR